MLSRNKTRLSTESEQVKKYSIALLIILIAFGCVFGMVYLLMQRRMHAPSFSASEQVKRIYTVTYTDSGYSPSSLEVPLGATVVFQNDSTVPLWTASDPHPTHTDYAEFDSHANTLPGESYSFIFTKSGTFGYHNHARSIHRGIVRVLSKSQLPSIDKTVEGKRAVRDGYMNQFVSGDPSSIYAVMDAIEANSALARDCHDMAHDLGHRAYELYGFSGAMTFGDPNRLSNTSTDDICAGGYMHGILEELFLHQPELKDAPGSVCAGVPYINRGSCFHGVGHGLMFANKRDVPTSLTTCKSLAHREDAHRCYEGVWMEMFWGNVEHAGSNSLGWTLEDPLAPCKRAGLEEKPACFLYAHLGYLRTHKADYAGMVALCTANNLEKKDEQFCLKGVGITMMKHFSSHRLENTEPLVAGLDHDSKYAYYQGVIGYSRLSAVSEQDLHTFCTWLKTDRVICEDVLRNGTD